MKSHFFAYIARMRFIQRWALMRNTAAENVQEHSHQVAVLAHALAVIRNEKFGGLVDAGAVAVTALYHDASEILTGDMPTPIKYYNPAMKDAYKHVERRANQYLLDMLPQQLRDAYVPYMLGEDEQVEHIVKAADKLAAYIKCVEEQKAGNLEFESAARQTLESMHAMERPELNWFIAECLPAFALNLDELGIM